MKTTGMRTLRTLQTLRNSALPKNRADMAAQLARLEHERARLEREMATWTQKEQSNAESLAGVTHQIEELCVAMYGGTGVEAQPRPEGRGTAKPARPSAGQPVKEDDSPQKTESTKGRKVVTLDY